MNVISGRGGSWFRNVVVGAVMVLGPSAGTACGSFVGPESAREATLFVASQRVACVGLAPQSCLRVRELTQPEWQLFYDGIAGFNYEPGFEYELRVRVDRVKNPPADASNESYTLIRVVRKSPAAA